jgi:hypothetical protein
MCPVPFAEGKDANHVGARGNARAARVRQRAGAPRRGGQVPGAEEPGRRRGPRQGRGVEPGREPGPRPVHGVASGAAVEDRWPESVGLVKAAACICARMVASLFLRERRVRATL